MANYSKNRQFIIDEMLSEYGYIFCQNCGTSKSFKFEVHHIIFRSEKPNHPEIHNKLNLLIVCRSCHNNFHGKKELRNRLVESRKLKELFNLK